ncbi:MAG: c-type cytochrome [Rhodobacteraceae bacterium]|nr:c-type cytochrome [Paracoccaceae bacterium]
MRCKWAVILGLAGGVLGMPGWAEPPSGAALFRHSCATCHGLAARGDGPMASILAVPIPDLTLLSARAGGVFPLVRVVALIDGRDPLVAHGGPMPIFGFSLEADQEELGTPEGTTLRTGAEIAAIARWLESVQR